MAERETYGTHPVVAPQTTKELFAHVSERFVALEARVAELEAEMAAKNTPAEPEPPQPEESLPELPAPSDDTPTAS